MQVTTAEEAAIALGLALGIRFGEITVQFSDGGVTILRRLDTYKPADLRLIPVDRPSP